MAENKQETNLHEWITVLTWVGMSGMWVLIIFIVEFKIEMPVEWQMLNIILATFGLMVSIKYMNEVTN